MGALVDEIALELGDANKPCASTVNKWVKDYYAGNCDIRVLTPASHRKGNRKERTYQTDGRKRWEFRSWEVAAHLTDAIREYLRAERPNKKSVADHVGACFAGVNAGRAPEIGRASCRERVCQ